MEPLSLRILNNQIVSMRKEVKRALVYQIHHLSTAAKRLRSKKGTDEQKLKNGSKANSMVEEIQILKKFKPDDISMFGLTNFDENEIKNFISKQIIAPETKAMAKLCLRKNLRCVIDNFIASRSSEIDLLNRLLGDKYLHKENKENKKQKKEGNKNDRDLYNVSSSDSDESISELVSMTLGGSDLEDNKNHNLLNENVSKKIYHDSDSISHVDVKQKFNSKPVQIKESKSKSLGSKKNLTVSLNEINTENNIEKQYANIKEKNSPNRKNIDPFFMTRDNSEYHTYCNIEANSKIEKEENSYEKHNNNHVSFQSDSKKGNINEKLNRKKDFFDNKKNQHHKFNNKRTITYLGGKNKNTFGNRERKDLGKHPSHQDSSTNVKLHPSWEAKKKMTAVSAPFQGKKITFDD